MGIYPYNYTDTNGMNVYIRFLTKNCHLKLFSIVGEIKFKKYIRKNKAYNG